MIGYVRGIFGRTYWSIRMRYWLWRERRTLTRLESFSLLLRADRLPSREGIAVSPSFGRCIPEVAAYFRLQHILIGDGNNGTKPRSGELNQEDQSLGRENVRRVLTEREAELIAEYDAHFLASIRIKSPVSPWFE